MLSSLITAKQLSERLNVAVSTVYYLVEKGRIPHYRLSCRSIRFCEREIDDWLRKECRKGEVDGCKSKKRKNIGNKYPDGRGEISDIEHIVERAKRDVLG